MACYPAALYVRQSGGQDARRFSALALLLFCASALPEAGLNLLV